MGGKPFAGENFYFYLKQGANGTMIFAKMNKSRCTGQFYIIPIASSVTLRFEIFLLCDIPIVHLKIQHKERTMDWTKVLSSAFEMDVVVKETALKPPEIARLKQLLAVSRDPDIRKKLEDHLNNSKDGRLLSMLESINRKKATIEQVIKDLTEALNEDDNDDSVRMSLQSRRKCSYQQLQEHTAEYNSLLANLIWEYRTFVRGLFNLKTRQIPITVTRPWL